MQARVLLSAEAANFTADFSPEASQFPHFPSRVRFSLTTVLTAVLMAVLAPVLAALETVVAIPLNHSLVETSSSQIATSSSRSSTITATTAT